MRRRAQRLGELLRSMSRQSVLHRLLPPLETESVAVHRTLSAYSFGLHLSIMIDPLSIYLSSAK